MFVFVVVVVVVVVVFVVVGVIRSIAEMLPWHIRKDLTDHVSHRRFN